MLTRIRFAIGLALAIVSCAAAAQATQYPSRPVRLLVGFAPGGATDIIARQIAPGLTESLPHLLAARRLGEPGLRRD